MQKVDSNEHVSRIFGSMKTENQVSRKHFILSTISIFVAVWVLGMLSCRDNDLTETAAMPPPISQYCTTCHGPDLDGGMSQSLLDGNWQFGGERRTIFRWIKFGLPHVGMPSWQSVMSDDEIYEIVDFILEEEKRRGITKPPIPDSIEVRDYVVNVEKYVEGLEIPWSIDFISQEQALITERPGRLRMVNNGILSPDSIVGIPSVLHEGQGGLMDVALDPAYPENGWVYLAYSHVLTADTSERPPAMTRLVRGRIENMQWTDQQVIFEAPHETYRTTRHHYGCRIVFDHQGYLYFSIGDRGSSEHAQDITRPNGKIHRIHRDGRIPRDNPFVGQRGAIESIYTLGNRNAQGLAVHPETGQVWETEHGPLGGDELNLITAGTNYGWPVITYGLNYNGTVISEIQRQEGMEQPILYWNPSIAACGLDFYSGDLFPKWKNRLMVGALRFEELQLLEIEKDRVIYGQTILKNAGRVRDVTTGPDGAIYVVLNRPGTILRLTPRFMEDTLQ